jgi:hypothetical protein
MPAAIGSEREARAAHEQELVGVHRELFDRAIRVGFHRSLRERTEVLRPEALGLTVASLRHAVALAHEYSAARHVRGACVTRREYVEQWQANADRAHSAQKRATTVPL